MIESVYEPIFVFLFYVAVIILIYVGVAKSVMLISLCAFVVMLAGTVWAFGIFGTAWYIPLLFTLGGTALFTHGALASRPSGE